MIPYQAKIKKLPGSNYAEVRKQALILFNQIKKKTKRKSYVRSAYFNKQKVFFDFFWTHLFQKSLKERTKRLRFFSCAVDLIKNSRIAPTSKENVNNRSEILHRFEGQTRNKETFFVQIKEDKKSSNKYFMSCFSRE
jgi:hypothetical protein